MKGKIKHATFSDKEVFKTTATIQELSTNKIEIMQTAVASKYRADDSSECSVDLDEVEGNYLKNTCRVV
jgi:hypothetical protein